MNARCGISAAKFFISDSSLEAYHQADFGERRGTSQLAQYLLRYCKKVQNSRLDDRLEFRKGGL
jgi:hypothetical protein